MSVCSNCEGRGWFLYRPGQPEGVILNPRMTCPMCGGSGSTLGTMPVRSLVVTRRILSEQEAKEAAMNGARVRVRHAPPYLPCPACGGDGTSEGPFAYGCPGMHPPGWEVVEKNPCDVPLWGTWDCLCGGRSDRNPDSPERCHCVGKRRNRACLCIITFGEDGVQLDPECPVHGRYARGKGAAPTTTE